MACDQTLVNKIKKAMQPFQERSSDSHESILFRMMNLKKDDRQGLFDAYCEEEEAEQEKDGFGSAYRNTGEAKVNSVIEFIETLNENGAKFLVFAHHQSVMNAIESYLQRKRVGYIRIDGKVTPHLRHEHVTSFQTDVNVRVALLSITAANVGLTLTAASTIVFAEMTWTPSIMHQAEDRAHRIGQKNSVNIYYMHGPGTLDDLIFKILQDKALVTSGITDGIRENLSIEQGESKELPLEEIMKDGTVYQKVTQPKIENFFKPKQDFVKRTKIKKGE